MLASFFFQRKWEKYLELLKLQIIGYKLGFWRVINTTWKNLIKLIICTTLLDVIWCVVFQGFSGFVTCLFGLSGKAEMEILEALFSSRFWREGSAFCRHQAELNKEYENLVVDWIWPPGTMIKEGKSSLHSMKTLDFLSFLASATAFSNQRHFLVCFVFDDLTVWQVVKLWFNFLACTRLHVMKHFFLFKTKQVMNDFCLRPNRFLLEKWLFYAFIAPFFPVAWMSSNISILFFFGFLGPYQNECFIE